MDRGLILLISMIFASEKALAIGRLTIDNISSNHEAPGLFNLILSLIFVIALIYLAGWTYQKLNFINTKKFFKKTDLKMQNKPVLLSGLSLGQNRNLYVVELNERIFLIGVTPNNISLIKEITNRDTSIKEILKKNDLTQNQKIIENLFNEEQEYENDDYNDDDEIDEICRKYM